MRILPNTNIDEKELYCLLKKGRINRGNEGIICKGQNPNTLYKLFVNQGNPVAMGDNKEKKIIELYKKQISYSVKPVGTISFKNMIIGYEMIDEYNLDKYELYELNKQELIYFLKETKKILEYYSANDIIYGDIEARNILFNKITGEIKFCDMDNIQINQYKMDIIPYKLNYYKEFRKIDSGVHSYLHNLMTLDAFYLDCFYSSKWQLRKLFSYDGLKIIKSMQEPINFNNDYLITKIKKI